MRDRVKPDILNDLVKPDLPSFQFNFKSMSNLQNESLLETFYEEALEELDVKNDSPFYADACKIAEEIAMDKFLSNNP